MAELTGRFGQYPRSADAMALGSVLIVSGGGTAALLRTGWVPSDEGTLAMSALRVYQGQLPQRDFAEIYTGGLSFFHAAAFHCFGVNLLSLRIAAFVVFLLWLPAVYAIVRRFLSPVWAAVATMVAAGWSYPNYPAAMPSWYNLFLATFGIWALLLFLEIRSRWWILLAGVFGGASILVKITGLYYVAGVLLFLLFVEQDSEQEGSPTSLPLVYRLICGSGLALYLVLVFGLLAGQRGGSELFQFFLPPLCCVAVLAWRERGIRARSSVLRLKRLLGLAGPFVAGIAVMVALFTAPYIATGSAHLLLRGVLGSAGARVSGLAGKMPLPGLPFAIYGFVTIGLISFALFLEWSGRRIATIMVAAVLGAVLVCSIVPAGLQDTWMMAGMLLPFVVLLAAILLLKNDDRDVMKQQRMMLMSALAATCTLIQFPVSYVTYFLYVAPLVLLATIAIVGSRIPVPGKSMLGTLLVFFLGMGWFGVVAKHVYNPELRFTDIRALSLPRAGGLLVDGTTPPYDAIIPLLQAHATNGTLYAGNDCPELYFLSGLKNVTRDDTGAADAEVIGAVRSGKVVVVAFNDEPFFASAQIAPQVRAEMQVLLPHTEKVGRFSVYWR